MWLIPIRFITTSIIWKYVSSERNSGLNAFFCIQANCKCIAATYISIRCSSALFDRAFYLFTRNADERSQVDGYVVWSLCGTSWQLRNTRNTTWRWLTWCVLMVRGTDIVIAYLESTMLINLFLRVQLASRCIYIPQYCNEYNTECNVCPIKGKQVSS